MLYPQPLRFWVTRSFGLCHEISPERVAPCRPGKPMRAFPRIYQDFEVHLVDSNGEDYHVHRLVEDPPTVCALENGSTASRAYPHDVFEDCIRWSLISISKECFGHRVTL